MSGRVAGTWVRSGQERKGKKQDCVEARGGTAGVVGGDLEGENEHFEGGRGWRQDREQRWGGAW